VETHIGFELAVLISAAAIVCVSLAGLRTGIRPVMFITTVFPRDRVVALAQRGLVKSLASSD